MTRGTAADHTRTATMLGELNGSIADLYATRTGKDKDEILQLMADETWFPAQKALDMGFATVIVKGKSPAKPTLPQQYVKLYRNVPAQLKAPLPSAFIGRRSSPLAQLAPSNSNGRRFGVVR